jgi:hypothetical protein
MRAKHSLWFILAVALIGCAPSMASSGAVGSASWPPSEPVAAGWKRIQVGEAFSFEAPADTQAVALRGIDSAVGGYKNDRFNVTFDYGAYSNSLSDETPWTAIDGHRARLEIGTGDCQVLPDDHQNWQFAGYVHVELRPAPRRLGLTMSGCAANEAGVEELRRLYLSLRFHPKAISQR